MPISISPNQLFAKKADGTGYLPANVISGETTEAQCAAVEATGQTTIDHVNQAVADAQSAVNTLDAQKNTIAQTIADMIQLGTDTTLSTPGMAADAGACGDLKSAIVQEAEDRLDTYYEIPELLGYELGNTTTDPNVGLYNNAGAGTITDDVTLSLSSGANVNSSRIGRTLLFQNEYFIGKKFIYTPHFTCSGDMEHFAFSVSKQSGNDAEIKIIKNDLLNPVVLIDFTNATLANIQYKYIFSILGGVGSYTVSQNTSITYTGYELKLYTNEEIKTLLSDVSSLKVDVDEMPSMLGFYREDALVNPTGMIAYNNAGSATFTDNDHASFASGASVYNFRLGKCLLFANSYFVGKKFIFEPHFSYTGDTSKFQISVSKQGNNDSVVSILDSNIENPKILLDFTGATLSGISYYYIYVILGGTSNYTVSSETTVAFTGYDFVLYDYSNSKNPDFIVSPCTLNVFERTKAITTGYYASNGAFVADPSYVISTPFIPMIKGEYISVSRLSGSQPIIDFWDANKAFLGTKSGYWAKCETDGTAYVTLTIFPSEVNEINITKGKITTVGGEIGYSSILHPFEYMKPITAMKNQWYSKHMATIGDSLTQMGYWQDHICNMLGMTYTKYAQSGGNMISIANFIDNVQDVPDLFTIWAGTNDWAGDIQLGDFLSDNDQTYAGAINKLCKKLGNDFQKSRVLFITPMQRGDTTNFPTQNKNEKGYYVNTNGKSLEDFADICKQTAEYYGYNCLDMFHDSGVNPLNIDYYCGDKLHPTLNGFEILAFHKMLPKIMSI